MFADLSTKSLPPTSGLGSKGQLLAASHIVRFTPITDSTRTSRHVRDVPIAASHIRMLDVARFARLRAYLGWTNLF